MTDIDLHSEVAVLCRNRDLQPEAVHPLFEHQTEFQYLPESVWAECEEKDGALYCRGRRYTAVVDDAGHFASVPRYTVETAAPDCLCEPAQPKLRCARFTKDSVECWFLVNEVNEPIHTALILPTQCKIGAYDLWNAAAAQQPGTQTENGVTIDFHLPVCGSVLLFACTAEEYASLPAPHAAYALSCPAFELVSADPATAKKVYRAQVDLGAADLSQTAVTLTVDAEEMAELTVNGQPAGVAFWSPQTFVLNGLLHKGENEFILTVTGNMANLYGKHPVEYGLVQDIHIS